MLAHIIGIPIEESVLQLAAAGAATVTAVWIAVRARIAAEIRSIAEALRRQRA